MNEALDLIFKLGPDEDENMSLEQGEAPHDGALLRGGGGILLFKANSTFLTHKPRPVCWRTRKAEGGGVQTKKKKKEGKEKKKSSISVLQSPRDMKTSTMSHTASSFAKYRPPLSSNAAQVHEHPHKHTPTHTLTAI